MFAYCGNQPVSNFDPRGNYYACAEDRITDGTTTSGGGLPPKLPYIDSQLSKDIGGLKLGDTTVGKMGCAVVASYNALVVLGHYMPFQRVLDYYNRGGDRHIADTGGIYTSSVVEYFETLGYTVTVIKDDYSKIDEMSQYADACLLSYRWDPNPQVAGHIVSYYKLNQNYIFFNIGSVANPYFKSPSAFLESNDFVSATGIFIFEE